MSERPAALRRVPTPADRRRRADPQGKRSLFSDEVAPPALGSVALECSTCQVRSVVSFVQATKLALPSLYLPTPGRVDQVWMKCPACRKRNWMKVRVKG